MTEILLPATLDSATRKKDKSVVLKFTTNFEISTEDYMQIDRLIQTIGWLKYRDNEVPEGLPEEDATEREGKSFIQRLRAVKFLQWKQGDQSEPFNVKWERYKEALLDKEKERLD